MGFCNQPSNLRMENYDTVHPSSVAINPFHLGNKKPTSAPGCWTTQQTRLPASSPTYVQMTRSHPPEVAAALFQWPLQQMLELLPAILRPWIKRGHQYMLQQSRATQKHAWLNTHDICSFFHLNCQSANDLHPPWETLLTALVWVFFVQFSLRVITLKKQVFF